MNRFINDILTGINNKTFDIGRVGIAVTLLFYLIFESIKIAITHTFHEIDFAVGAITILTGGACGLALKYKTEPPLEPQKDNA